MTERPIIMQAESARAILAGTKTQTRRVVKAQPVPEGNVGRSSARRTAWLWKDKGLGAGYCHTNREALERLMVPLCPYGAVGDRLWVREAWYCDDYTAGNLAAARVGYVGKPPSDAKLIKSWQEELYFRADGEPEWEADGPTPWKSPLFMPRWASRLVLEIVEIRVQRLHEITDAEILSEGITLKSGQDILGALARRCPTRPLHWLHPEDDHEDYCTKCGTKKVRELNRTERKKKPEDREEHILDGGWATEEDRGRWCSVCGVRLDHNLTDYGARDVIEGYADDPLVEGNADAAYGLLEAVNHLQFFEGRAEYAEEYAELLSTARRVLWANAWERINGKRKGCAWADDPWVWAVTFKRVTP